MTLGDMVIFVIVIAAGSAAAVGAILLIQRWKFQRSHRRRGSRRH